MSKTAYTGGLFHRIVRRIAIRLQVAGVVLQHLPGYRATTGGIILIERDMLFLGTEYPHPGHLFRFAAIFLQHMALCFVRIDDPAGEELLPEKIP